MANKECFHCGNTDKSIPKVKEHHFGNYYCAFKHSGYKDSCINIAKEIMKRKD